MCRERYENDGEDVSEMGESASGEVHGQKYGVGYYADNSGSVLYDALHELREPLARGCSSGD